MTATSDLRFVRFPHLHIERSDAGCVIENLVFATKLKASIDLVEVLEAFATPKTIAEFLHDYDVPPSSLDPLFANFFLVPETEVGFLAGGLVTPLRHVPPIGHATTWWELDKHADNGGWVVFGAPCDTAATHAGARYGPSVVREAAPRIIANDGAEATVDDLELRRSYDISGLSVLDVGDISRTPGESIDVFGARVSKVVRKALDLGMRPAMIGGDHSVTWFALRELLDHHPALGVIHFDAHSDLYASVTDTVLTHANVLSFVLDRPQLDVLFQLGVRTLDRVEPFSRRVDDARLRWLSTLELRQLEPAAAFASLRRDIPYYLTFDIDCIDPAIAPETGAPVPGGLDYYQGLTLIDYAARELDLVGCDIVEVAGSDRKPNLAAAIAGRYLCQLLLGRAPHRTLTSYLHRHQRSR